MLNISKDALPFNSNFKRPSELSSTSSTSLEHPEHVDDNIIISPEDIHDEYDHNEDFRGLFVLFNHEEFASHAVREGTSNDENELVVCLSRLGYDVTKDLLYKNYTKKQVQDELSKIAQMDHSERNSLIVVFLTHGDEDGKLYCSDSEIIRCEEVWNLFTADKCPSLEGKPKIFIFQACKGNEKSKAADRVQADNFRRNKIARQKYTIPAGADILVAYSTLEGNVSFRNTISGSWFIQELCKTFTAYGRRDDIVTLFMRISKCVAHHYQHKEYKQMPCFISTLTRKFYLCKSKERGHILDLREQNKKLLELVLKLQEKVDVLGVLVLKKEENKEDKTG